MSWSDWAELAVQAYGAYSKGKAQTDAARDIGNQAQAASDKEVALQRDMWQRQLALMQPQYNAGNWALGQLTSAVGGPSDWGNGYSGQAGGTGGFQNWVEEDANGVPIPNAQLYQSDPQYRQAWDAALQTHQGQWKGNGYWHGSDNEWIRSQIGQRYTPPAQTQPATGTAGQPGNAAQSQAKLFEMFRNAPGYQFGLQEGVRGIDASSAAAGQRNSGKTLKALMEHGQNYADAKGWQPYLGTLKDIAGLTNSVPAQLGQAGQNFANQAGQSFQNAARIRAGSTYDAGQAKAQTYNDYGRMINDFGTNKGWWS